jgi:hypothetical protein
VVVIYPLQVGSPPFLQTGPGSAARTPARTFPTALLPAVPTPRTMTPITPGLAPEEGVARPPSRLTILGVAPPGPPYPHHQAPVTGRPLSSLVLQGRLPLLPCRPLGPGSTGSRSGAIATVLQT